MPYPGWPRCHIEVFERQFGFLDDHFRSGWVLIRSAASQSFVNNGGLVADLGVMTVTESDSSDGAGYEKGSLSISTDTYRKCRVRLKGAGYKPYYMIYVKFSDASDVNASGYAPTEMTEITVDLPVGKTVIAVQLFVRSDTGGNNQTAALYFDYVAIIKDSPVVPQEVESLDVELCATTAVSGFRFTLLNDRGIYTEKPSVGDLVMIYLAANGEALDQKLISGYVADKEMSGDPGNPLVTIAGSDLGQVFCERTFTKKYTASAKISQVVKDVRDGEITELTAFSVEDTDNEVTPEFNEEGVFNLLRKLADASLKGTTYGYDFYVDPAGDIHFVPNPKYTCAEKIYAGIFYDDFRGNLDKWVAVTGSWPIESEELSQSDKSAGAKRVWAGKTHWQDYAVQADVKYVADGDSKIGLAFRVQDDTHFYALLVDKASGELQLYWTDDGGSTLNSIGSTVTGLTFVDQQFYELKAEVEDTSIKCYLDGELKKTETDSRYATGKTGLFTLLTHAHFDNVQVKAVNEPAYNIKKISWKETAEDVANQIQLLTREAEYQPRDTDAWTENISNWSSPQPTVIFAVDNTDKKVGNNSIKADLISDPGLKIQVRRRAYIDVSLFRKIKFWDKWSLTGPVDWWVVRLYTKEGDYTTDYYQRKLWIGQTGGVPKPWSTQEIQNLSDFTKVGNPSNDIVCIEIALENDTSNIGTGYFKIDGLHFAIDPITKTASDSSSQSKYGIKERDFDHNNCYLSPQNHFSKT